MHTADHSAGTRDRLLDIACGLFAEKGYASTSISEITRLAGANKAAVNYHFSSKEKLYQEAWRYAHDALSRRFPTDGGVVESEPADERLRGWVRSGLQRALLGDATEFRIMRMEMANPTGLLHRVIDDAIRPLRQAMHTILRELLGPKATDRDIELCEVCVVAPCLHITHHQRAERHEGLAPIFHEDMLEDMVDHFTAFALAGIRQARQRIEQDSGEGQHGGASHTD